MSNLQATLDAYVQHVEERANLPYAFECIGQGIDPKPIEDAATAEAILAVLKGTHQDSGEKDIEFWFNAFENGIFPATEASTVKANALEAAAKGEGDSVHGYTNLQAVEALGRMRGGQAIVALTNLLSANADIAEAAAEQMKTMALSFHSWEAVFELSATNEYAKSVVDSWGNAEWFQKGADMPDSVEVVICIVPEGNTEPLSPATQAHTREDLSYHSLAWMKKVNPDAIKEILALKAANPGKLIMPVFTKKAFAGSSRATGAWNTVRWFGEMAQSLPGFWWGGLVAASVIDAKGYNALLGIGTIPVQIGEDYKNLSTGQIVNVNLKDGKIEEGGNTLATFSLSKVERITYKAGGSSNFLAGRLLTGAVRQKLGLSEYDWGIPGLIKTENGEYTALQKLFGSKVGLTEGGVAPGSSGLFDVDLMASQDTTGTITRLALRLLACEKFVPPVLQTLCHTSAHPKANDLVNFETLPKFFRDREGIGLHRGDGVIHSWLKKMSALGWLIVIGDSHGRNVFGAAVPGDSLLVATAGAFGKIPYTMPKSIRVEFKGDWRKVKPRDIQLALIEQLLSMDLVDQYDEKNILNGMLVEIYGLDEMPSEKKFEIMNAMGEYGPASQWIYTPTEIAVKEVKEFVEFWEAYKGTERGDVGIQKLIDRLNDWLANPYNPVEDANAEYHYKLEVNLQKPEPLVTLPGVTRAGRPGNSYLNVRRLSEVPEAVSSPDHLVVEEGMVLSCVSRTQHFTDSMVTVMGYIEKNGSVGGDRLWYSAPTVDIEREIREMGLVDKLRASVESAGLVFWDFKTDDYNNRKPANFRWEMPGCSLCMGNQEVIDVAGAKEVHGVESVRDIRVVWGSNTRNNDGRVGPKGETFSFICDPFLATCAFLLRKPPTVEEYDALEILRDESKAKYLA